MAKVQLRLPDDITLPRLATLEFLHSRYIEHLGLRNEKKMCLKAFLYSLQIWLFFPISSAFNVPGDI